MGLIDRHPSAFEEVVTVLNRRESEEQLVARASREPALAAVVQQLEARPNIVAVLDDPDQRDDGLRFRQLVGVAVKLKMRRLGWTTTGRKGSMARYTDRFGSAEMYERADPAPSKGADGARGTDADSYRERALAGLAEMRKIGTEEERQRDREELLAALAETRRLEGRPF